MKLSDLMVCITCVACLAAIAQNSFGIDVVKVGKDAIATVQSFASGGKPTPSGDDLMEFYGVQEGEDQWNQPHQ